MSDAGASAPPRGTSLALPRAVGEHESGWVGTEFRHLAGPVEAQLGAGRFPRLSTLVELAHAPHPVFAPVLRWREASDATHRTIGLALHTLRLYSPRSVTRLDWMLSPGGWLDCYALEDGRLVLAAIAHAEDAESRGLELVRASARIQESEGRRVDAAELLVVGGGAGLRSRLVSLPARFLGGNRLARFTVSLVESGRADRQFVARQPGAGVEDTRLHPETVSRLELPPEPGLELECQDPDEGVYRFCPRGPQTGRIVVADARGRARREDGRHGTHPDALRRSGDRALAMLGPASGDALAHRICVVLDAAIEADLHDLVAPLESLVPAARRGGVGRIDIVTRLGGAGSRTLVGSLCQRRESRSVQWRWFERQSHGTRLRSS